jgi:two-component system sensor kinase FixL
MPDPYKSEHDDYVERYERTGERRAIGQIRIVSARRKDGEVFPIELSVTEMRVGAGVRYGAFIRDISEKVRLQEQLMDRERLALIGTTAAMFAHEIGNPLNSMSLQLQLLQRRIARDGKADGAWVAEKAGLVRSELQRLITLLDEFRSMSRRQQYEFIPCDLSALVERVVRAERANFESKGVNVTLSLQGDPPPVLADEDKLTQVVINLCKNAVEAMEGEHSDPGKLTLRTAVEEDRLLIEITDTGPGLPGDVDVFQPFVTTKKGGTGLGLPIVRQIVSAHDGSIDYFSQSGESTTFRLRFPLQARDDVAVR